MKWSDYILPSVDIFPEFFYQQRKRGPACSWGTNVNPDHKDYTFVARTLPSNLPHVELIRYEDHALLIPGIKALVLAICQSLLLSI